MSVPRVCRFPFSERLHSIFIVALYTMDKFNIHFVRSCVHVLHDCDMKLINLLQ